MFLYLFVTFLASVEIASTVEDSIKCIQLKHCPLALKLVETKRNDTEVAKFLRFSHCGFNGKEPKVWCHMLDECKDPDGKEGKCTSVRKCDSFVNLIKKSDIKKPEMWKYLNKFRCSTIYDPDIKVCCTELEKPKEVDGDGNDVSESRNVKDRFSFSLQNPRFHNCGTQSGDNRITGGVETDLSEYPWMALLRYQNEKGGFSYACGGALITSKVVLTAGHCLDQIILKSKGLKRIHSIILGEYDTRNKTDCFYMKYGTDCADPVREIQMDSFLIHPGYMSGYTEHDIGMIRLREQVDFTDFISPICLPPATVKLGQTDIFMIAGWGQTYTEKNSPVKRKARINIVPNEKCNGFTDNNLDENKLCAGGTGDGVDACFGDSGGPLMLGRNVDNRYVNFVIGVVSHGFGRTCGDKPGVYTYVPYYVEWIESNLVF